MRALQPVPCCRIHMVGTGSLLGQEPSAPNSAELTRTAAGCHGGPLHCPSSPACVHAGAVLELSPSFHGLFHKKKAVEATTSHFHCYTSGAPGHPGQPRVLPLDAAPLAIHPARSSATTSATGQTWNWCDGRCHLGCRPQSSSPPKPPHPHTCDARPVSCGTPNKGPCTRGLRCHQAWAPGRPQNPGWHQTRATIGVCAVAWLLLPSRVPPVDIVSGETLGLRDSLLSLCKDILYGNTRRITGINDCKGQNYLGNGPPIKHVGGEAPGGALTPLHVPRSGGVH